jgi:glycosyltransferase involved in cell wall biosynthesis
MLEPWAMSNKRWKKAPYFRLVERAMLSKASAVHALTQAEHCNIRALAIKTPTFVIPNGVSENEVSATQSAIDFEDLYPQTKGKKKVLFLGRIDPKKGIENLVRAFAQLVRGEFAGRTVLVIAGPDLVGHRQRIEETVRAYDIDDHVLFTGALSGTSKASALRSADLFVLPSLSEGFSVAVLEALACGCPVIITEKCNFPEVAAAQAGKVIAPNAEQLAEALRDLLRNDEERRDMGANGRNLIRRCFTWQTIAARLRSVYHDLDAQRRDCESWSA